MIAFLWAYNVVIIAFILTFKILAALFRVLIVAPAQAVIGIVTALTIGLIYALFAVSLSYAVMTLLVVAVVALLGFFAYRATTNKTSNSRALTGSALLYKVRELGEASKEELVLACGYTGKDRHGTEYPDYQKFYDALLKAKRDESS